MHPLLAIQSKARGGVVEEIELPTESNSDLEMASQELIEAIQKGDSHEVAEAIRACFQILDAEPHVEGEHV